MTFVGQSTPNWSAHSTTGLNGVLPPSSRFGIIKEEPTDLQWTHVSQCGPSVNFNSNRCRFHAQMVIVKVLKGLANHHSLFSA